MAGIDGGDAGTEFVGSHEKAKNGYGQNGYQGPASDLPGQSTRMDRDFGLDADPSVAPGDWQTRNVSKDAYPTTFGMKAPAEPAKIPDANVRRARIQAAPGSYQR
jgi:hypothetical protein